MADFVTPTIASVGEWLEYTTVPGLCVQADKTAVEAIKRAQRAGDWKSPVELGEGFVEIDT